MKNTVSNNKRIILIIDDDCAFQLLLHKRLEASGYECFHAISIQSGINVLENIKPELILLDIVFEGDTYDASDFLKLVRNHILTQKEVPPILIISSVHDKEVVSNLLSNGASAYIGKPYEPAALLSIIKEYVRKMPDKIDSKKVAIPKLKNRIAS